MFGQSLCDMSVLGSQVFRQPSMESCEFGTDCLGLVFQLVHREGKGQLDCWTVGVFTSEGQAAFMVVRGRERGSLLSGQSPAADSSQ